MKDVDGLCCRKRTVDSLVSLSFEIENSGVIFFKRGCVVRNLPDISTSVLCNIM